MSERAAAQLVTDATRESLSGAPQSSFLTRRKGVFAGGTCHLLEAMGGVWWDESARLTRIEYTSPDGTTSEATCYESLQFRARVLTLAWSGVFAGMSVLV
jgi:hypothetical protein